MGRDSPNHKTRPRALAPRVALLLFVAAAILAFFLFGGSNLLTLEELQGRREALAQLVASRPVTAALVFAGVYIAVVALSVPGAAIMTLASGALFGFFPGLVIASLSATIGATLAMLVARYLARDWVKSRFPAATERIDRGIANRGDAYLLSLRLAPVVPFFLINIAMGLTAMPALRFALLSLIGSLPGAAAYTAAGTALAGIDSLSDVLSPSLIGALLALALLPLVGRWAARWVLRRYARRGFKRPRRFDANVIVIGAGSAGLVASIVATELKSRVVLIERGAMGGDCLNTGCVPSKSLIRAARAAREVRGAGRFGVEAGEPRVDFAATMGRLGQVIESIAPNDSVERFRGMGVDVRTGSARLVDPWTVEIDGSERISAPQIIVATGAEPVIPPIPGIEYSGYVTSDTIWKRLSAMPQPPRNLVVLGGGPIGCELGQALAQLGSKVAILTRAERLLDREDMDASRAVEEAFAADGILTRCGRSVVRIGSEELELDNGETLPFDMFLVATGRKVSFEELGLEALGIAPDASLDGQSREPWPHIRFAGDAAGGLQFTHFAGHSGAIAAINAIGAPFAMLRTESLVPRVTYTSPEVAAVGLSEQQACDHGREVEIVRYDLRDLDRAVIDGATAGFLKLVVAQGSDRILGATIVGANAGELIVPWVLAIKQRVGLKKMLALIYPYPTFSEASRAAAGEWRKKHKPERLLSALARWNAWRRG